MEKKIQEVIEKIEDKKGKDIEVIDLTNENTIGSFYIIATANTGNHARSIADEIQDYGEEIGEEIPEIEGYRNGKWLLVDLDDIIVHIFQRDEREYYDLEYLWKEIPKKD